MRKAYIHVIGLFITWLTIGNIQAQVVVQTDFEQFNNGTNFTRASWQTAGFTVPWVNGFDANRGMIDNTHAKSGSRSLRLFYPQGEFGTAATGGQAPLIVPPRDEYYMSYYVRFSDNFSWGTSSEGGKLPGLSGGERCSGCRACTGSNGFTARLMWRQNGKAVVYLYHLNKAVPECGDNYDIVVGGQTVLFQKGVWYKISQRVKVNSGTNSDGEVEMWINDEHAQLKLYNGTLVDKLTGLQFVSNGDKVDALYFSTFHGGGDNKWAPTTDSYAWFDDVVISTRKEDVVSAITSSEAKSEQPSRLYPTLLHQGDMLFLPHISKPTEVTWFDLLGNYVAVGEVAANGASATPALSSGIYLMRYTQGDVMHTEKVLIE